MKRRVIVSIIIPTYNVEKYIEELLKCIQEQTYKDYEVLFVDDGSTDNTCKIIQKSVNSQIRLIQRDRNPKGAQTCRNIGIEKSKGKYLIFVDSDDLISKDFIKQRVEYMESHREIDYATFKAISFKEENGKKIYGRKRGKQTKKNLLHQFLKYQYPFCLWNNIYKREFCEQVKFDERIQIHQDFDYAIRIIFTNAKQAFAKNHKMDYFYRKGHENSITANYFNHHKYDSTKYLLEKTMKEIENLKHFRRYKRFLFHFFLVQYERVMIYNPSKKNDFEDFIQQYYSFPYTIKLRMLKKLLNKVHSKRAIRILFASFYRPQDFILWIWNKLLKKNIL